jgi:dihydrofolate synthase/folylpolyglutamate synthase
VRAVALRLGLLPLRVPAVLVGGTNGKGSTATTLATLLHAAGLRTGLFTSPHLIDYNERIRVDGRPADDAALCAAFERIEAASGTTSLSFFEYNALAALELCARAGVQSMVLEVGLGGRLDATNIVDADVAVLCSIGLDHTEWLGATLELIGAEKAGIFRAGGRVVLATDELPHTVFDALAELQCRVRLAGRDFDWQLQDDGQWSWRCDGHAPLGPLPPPRLWGAVQYRNAAAALAAWQALHEAQPERVPAPTLAAATRGLQSVTLPGRLQVLERGAEWVLDVAHNVPAAQVLIEALRTRAPARRTCVIFGMLGDKDVAGVTAVLEPLVDEWWLCGIDAPRGLTAAALGERMGTTRAPRRAFADVPAACAQALRTLQAGERVLVCGSFHIVGPALQSLGV